MLLKNVGIFAKPGYKSIDITVQSIIDYFVSNKVNTFVDFKTAERIKWDKTLTEDILNKIDLIVTVGGDGTVLYAAHFIKNKSIPVLTINMGSIGFITEIEPKDFKKAMEAIITDNFMIEERNRLEITINDIQLPYALNELLIKTCPESKLIPIQIFLNNIFLEKFKADGIIIATPTGSTAHSLSAGGPILFPSIDGFIILPMNPIELYIRPIVVDDATTIDIHIKPPSKGIYLIVDGQYVFKVKDVSKKAKIRVVKSKWPLPIIRFDRYNFIRKIAKKFGK